eukprot:486404_1
MEANKNTEEHITKSTLKTIHDRQLMNGQSNNLQKEAIISTLGGIDQILSDLVESNAHFNHKQLQSLHNIITGSYNNTQTNTININTTTKNIEDKGYERRLEQAHNKLENVLSAVKFYQTLNLNNHNDRGELVKYKQKYPNYLMISLIQYQNIMTKHTNFMI